MSGGSLNYLYQHIHDRLNTLHSSVGDAYTQLCDLPTTPAALEAVKRVGQLELLLELATELAEQVAVYDGPLHVAEWWMSGDYDDKGAADMIEMWHENRKRAG